VAWFSGSSSEPKVQLLISEDGGASFGKPIRIDDGRPVGRVDVEWIGESVIVSWHERTEERQGEIRVKRVAASGDPAPAVVVARTASGRASGFPRMTRFQNEMYVTWTESYDRQGPSQVHVAKLVDKVALLDEPAYGFEAEDVDGKIFRLRELEGKVVLLNFWGIWCKSCRQEIPHLAALDRRLRGRGLILLGADYGDAPEDLPAFIEELGMSYPVLLDDGLADDYEVLVYPTSVVIDRAGRVRYRVEGFREKSFRDLERVVERLLAENYIIAERPDSRR
jgi:thiol-disulfide isomerase/thioredoxin